MLIRCFVVATGIFLVALTTGIFLATEMSAGIMKEFGELLKPLTPAGNMYLFFLLIIFINNAVKTLGVICSSILFGIPSLLFISLNGFIIGGVVSVVKSLKGCGYTVASMVPHGVIEIPILLLAAALGLTVGVESFKWLQRRQSQVRSRLSDCLRLYLRWVLPGLAAAALIEVFVTPWLMTLAAGE